MGDALCCQPSELQKAGLHAKTWAAPGNLGFQTPCSGHVVFWTTPGYMDKLSAFHLACVLLPRLRAPRGQLCTKASLFLLSPHWEALVWLAGERPCLLFCLDI